MCKTNADQLDLIANLARRVDVLERRQAQVDNQITSNKRDIEDIKMCTVPDDETQPDRIKDVCNDVRDLLIRKNHDYGDSFAKQYEKYGLMSSLIRMDDKLKRLETLHGGEQAQVAESIEDTLKDLAGYALLTLVELRK